MAPKRSAPPAPVESSEETSNVADSMESSEEIAQSPSTAAPNNTAPLPQMEVEQPEGSADEDEDEDVEEEGEDGEEEEDSEEEEENGTEDEEEPPQPVSAPKQVAKEKGGTPPPSSEDKKPTLAIHRSWSKDDEVRILEALAAHRRAHGTLPQVEDLEATLAGSLDNSDHSVKELAGKLKSLKGKYTRNVKKFELPSKGIDRQIFALSKEVWGSGGDKPANAAVRRDFGKVCQMYPYLAEEIKILEKKLSSEFKREFSMIDDDKARALDQKIKKQRLKDMQVELSRMGVMREVTKTLMSLVD